MPLKKQRGQPSPVSRIGEETSNWLLLGESRRFVSRMKRLRQAMERALENDNVDLYEIEEKNLLREILKFTGWIFRLSSENS